MESYCNNFMTYSEIKRNLYTFSNEIGGEGGGGNELSLRFIVLLLHGHSCVFTVQ